MRLSFEPLVAFVLFSLWGIVTGQTADQITVVNLADNTGTPEHLASGFIYGIPNVQLQIPDSFYEGQAYSYRCIGVFSP